jgi:hypothetical protein
MINANLSNSGLSKCYNAWKFHKFLHTIETGNTGSLFSKVVQIFKNEGWDWGIYWNLANTYNILVIVLTFAIFPLATRSAVESNTSTSLSLIFSIEFNIVNLAVSDSSLVNLDLRSDTKSLNS